MTAVEGSETAVGSVSDWKLTSAGTAAEYSLASSTESILHYTNCIRLLAQTPESDVSSIRVNPALVLTALQRQVVIHWHWTNYGDILHADK